MPINYKVKQLYDALKEDGADVGSEQEFNDWFFKPGDEGYKNRRSVYDAFKEDGADIGKDYGEFAGWLGLHAVEAQKQSPALTQDVRRPQAPLPQAATSVHAAAQKPAKPQPVQRQQTAQQPVTYFRLRRGGKDFNVSADEVRKAGGLQAWANRHPGAPVRVYMQGNGFNGHVDLSQAHNRYAKQGYKYSTTTAKTPVKAMSRPEKQPTVKPAEQPMTDMQKEMLLDNLQGIVNNARSSNTRTIQQMKNKLEYDKKSRNGFLGGPVEGGVQYNPSTGKMEQTYLTPQGYKTTSKGDADMMSQQYREQQAFRQRMKVNGLKPDNKEDVQKQMQLDEEKPMRDVLNDVWGEAEAQDKKAQEAWRNRADKNARGFSLSDAAAASSSAGAVFAGRGEDFNNDLEYQKKRHAIFDFDKMANTMYARLPEDYRRGTLERYTDYFKKHPKDAKGKTAAIAAKDALMGDLYRQVYERAKAQDMPKSKLEFLLRKIADQPLISSSMAANTVAAWQTGSHGLDLAEQDAMSTFGKQHKTLDIAGTVANMALDPVTYAAGGVGGVVGKKALQAVGKQALKGATKKVAERYAAGTLAGRVAQGAAGGAANFGTFNTVKGIQQQMAVGGTLDENGKPTNELSAGDILKETAHGLMLGAATGTLSPLIGNVADKAVKATSSTAGKVALRAGQTALSTLAEGTVFAIPDMVDKGKWDWDTWTDSQAMMLGFKASHAIKSAPRVLQGLQREDRRIGLNFEERLRKQLDASPADIGFKPEEMEELRDKGYTGLSMLFRDANKRKADKSTGIEERTDDYENLTPDRFDGYEAMKRLMNDNSVSEATRAKAYYILTGHMLPMSSVVGYDVEKDDAGRVTVNSVNARGGVVTTRRFANEKAAGQEIDNIARQAELNAVNVGEKYKETASNMIVMEQAIKEVAPDADVATVLNNYKMVKSGQLTDEAYVRQAQAIDEAIARNRHIADPNRPEAIRENIKKETGIDVDDALNKRPIKRTDEEKAVVEEYIRSLFPEEKAEKPNNGGYEQIEPDAHYNRGYKSADDESGDEMRRVKTDYDTKRNGMADKYGEDNLAAIDDDPIGWLDANADKMSDEDAHVVTDYVNARYAYLGMTQRANDDADDAAVSAAAAVDARTNKDDGMIHSATLKDGGNVYIVSGNVVMSADGKSVDKGKSSKRIVVRDAQSGEMSMLPADDVIALDAPIDAQQERDAAAKAAAEQSRTASANVADGLTTHDNPQLGDEVYVRGDDGKPVRGIIRNVDSYTGDYMVETEAQIAGKKAQPFKAEQLYDRVQDDTDADTVADMGSNAIDTTIPTPDDSQSQPQQQQNSGETSAEASAAPVDSEQQKPETPAQPEDETEHQPQTEELQGSEQTAEVGQPASESEEAHTGETPARAIDKIPSEQVTDKKGNTRTVHHWEQANPGDTYDALAEIYHGNADRVKRGVQNRISAIDKQIKTIQKQMDAIDNSDDFDAVAAQGEQYDRLQQQKDALEQQKKYWQGVQNVPASRRAEQDKRTEAEQTDRQSGEGLPGSLEDGADQEQAAGAGQHADVAGGDKEDDEGPKVTLLDAVKALYSKGKEYSKKLYQRTFFYVADTPQFMKNLGLRGDKFTIKYGVISRHFSKDGSHDLTEDEWKQLPQALQAPFAISRLSNKKDGYRLYTTLKNSRGEYIVVGADVKNGGRNIEVNAISTVFGRRQNANLTEKEEVIYRSKNITPDQSALLDRPNSDQYPTEGELSSAAKLGNSSESGDKKEENVGEGEENGDKRIVSDGDFNVDDIDFEHNYVVIHQTMSRVFDSILRDGLHTAGGLLGTSLFGNRENIEDTLKAEREGHGHKGSDGLIIMQFPKSWFNGRRIDLDDISIELSDRFGPDAILTVPPQFITHAVVTSKMSEEEKEQPKAKGTTEKKHVAKEAQKVSDDDVKKERGKGEAHGKQSPSKKQGKTGKVGGNQTPNAVQSASAAEARIKAVKDKIAEVEARAKSNDDFSGLRNAKMELAELFGELSEEQLDEIAKTRYGGEWEGISVADDDVRDAFDRVYSLIERKRDFIQEKAEASKKIEPKTPQKKVSPMDFSYDVGVVNRNNERLCDAVYHDGGYVVGTNGKILYARKEDYPKELEGKMTNKKGEITEVGFPKKWRVAFPSAEDTVPFEVDIDALHRFVAGVRAADKDKSSQVLIKLPNGRMVMHKAKDLDLLLRAAKMSAAKVMICNNPSERRRDMLSFQGDDAAGAIMPCVFEFNEIEYDEHTWLYDASRGGEAQAKKAEEQPKEEQKEAGNYKKGHIKVDGYDITIENPKGSTRSGKDASGKAWSVLMHYDYGYIKGTEGVDGDHIDVYLSDNPTSGNVYVVDQIDQKTGKFDEHKVMYGFPSKEAAVEAYKGQYEKGWKVGPVTEVSREDFKKWVESSKRKTKPFSEYNSVKEAAALRHGPHGKNGDEERAKKSSEGGDGGEEYEKKAAKIRAEEILKEGLPEDAKFGTKAPSDIKSVEDIENNVTKIISGLKDAEEGKIDFDNYDGYVHSEGYDGNAGEQLFQYINGLREVTPELDKIIYEWAKKHSLRDVYDTVEYGKKFYQQLNEGHKKKGQQKKSKQDKSMDKASGAVEPVTKEEAALRDAVDELMREAGIEVIDDEKEGQRVLDEKNAEARLQASWNGLKKASNFILSSLSGKAHQRSTKIEIPERANRLAEKAIGHPIVSHSIRADELRHIEKRHGANGTANDKNSIPLRKEDIALMPYIMAAPTRVVKGTRAANGTESVRYEKDLSNGTVLIVEREGRFDVEDMENITMWAQKKPATNVTVAQGASHSTSETIVISETDAAKIRKDAEEAVKKDEKLREQRVYHGSGADSVRFFRTSGGEAYGFTVGGKIYIDPRIATSETPIHEYAHLWAEALRKANPKEWQNVVSLMKECEAVWEQVKREYPELTTDDEIADEVLAHYSGKRGAERLRAEMRKAMEGDKRMTEKAGIARTFDALRDSIKRFWKHISEDILHIHFTSADEVADKVMYDLLNKVKPGAHDQLAEERAEIERRAKEDGTWMKAPNGKESNLTEEQWVTVRTRQFKDWFGDWEEDPENSSQAVDENGEPLVVYHGTEEDFNIFELFEETGVTNTFQEIPSGSYMFTPDEYAAEQYGEVRPMFLNTRDMLDLRSKESILKVIRYMWSDASYYGPETLDPDSEETVVNGLAPLIKDDGRLFAMDFSDEEMRDEQIEEKWHFIQQLIENYCKDRGYDGYCFNDSARGEECVSYGVFLPNQIKSATDNVGTFDETNPDIRYQFVGEKGAASADRAEEATTRLDNLSVARKMEEAGKDAHNIKMATGWERGADEKWRYEIPDFRNIDPRGNIDFFKNNPDYKRYFDLIAKSNKAYFFNGEFTKEEESELSALDRKLHGQEYQTFRNPDKLTLKDYMDAPELFKAYPQLRNLPVKIEALPDNTEGAYTYQDGAPVIKISKGIMDSALAGVTIPFKRVMAHEIQHAIQLEEGFAKGGSIYSVRGDIEDNVSEMRPSYDWTSREGSKAIRLKNAASKLEFAKKIAANPEDYVNDPLTLVRLSMNGHKPLETIKKMPDADKIAAIKRLASNYWWEVVDDFANGLGEQVGMELPHNPYPEDGSEMSDEQWEKVNKASRNVPYADEMIAALRKRASAIEDYVDEHGMSSEEMSDYLRKNRALERRDDTELYASLAGDVEARNAARRVAMTDEQRRRNLASDTEDVSREDQIYLYDSFGIARSEEANDSGKRDGDLEFSTDQAVQENIENGLNALSRLAQGEEEVSNAMHREELAKLGGTAEISFIWGTHGHLTPSGRYKGGEGFQKIIDKHGVEDAIKVVETIAKGEIGKPYGVDGGQRVDIDLKDHHTTVSLYRNGESKSWVLTGYTIDYNTDAKGRGSDLRFATQNSPIRTRAELGAALQSEANIRRIFGIKETHSPDQNSKSGEEDNLYRTSGEIDAEYPNWLEGTTTDSGKHTTQVAGTRKTYGHVGDWIERHIGKDARILDASSGMGYGTKDLRQRGFNIEDVEPYQSEERKKDNPATYSSYGDVEGKYNYIISNAVLNVIPDDWRSDVLHDMASRLKAGGRLFINTRKAGEEKGIKDKIELDSPQEVLVKRNGKIASYQRFFTPQELKEYVEKELGEGYKVEIANEENSGTKGLAAVVVTKESQGESTGAKAASSSVQRMTSAVNDLAQKLHLNNVEIVTEPITVRDKNGKVHRPKGYFNPKTGKITISIANNADVDDAVSTLLHEAVAHYGLREMLGEDFDTFLDNVFANVNDDIRKKIEDAAKKRYDGDTRTATEEYLASLAEKENFEEARKKGVWDKIKELFKALMSRIGVKLKEKLTDNDLRYMLWRSYENLKEGGKGRTMLQEAEDAAKRYELGIDTYSGEYDDAGVRGEAKSSSTVNAAAKGSLWGKHDMVSLAERAAAGEDPELLFRDSVGPQDETARKIYDKRADAALMKIREAWQDSMINVKNLQDAVLEARGENIEDYEDAYMQENNLHGVSRAESECFTDNFYKPLLEEVNKAAKGWYDRRTGRITIVAGNHTSVADAESTLLHEAVAHYGLRQLLGDTVNLLLAAAAYNFKRAKRSRFCTFLSNST